MEPGQGRSPGPSREKSLYSNAESLQMALVDAIVPYDNVTGVQDVLDNVDVTADIDTKRIYGLALCKVLHKCWTPGQKLIVSLLLDRGADVNTISDDDPGFETKALVPAASRTGPGGVSLRALERLRRGEGYSRLKTLTPLSIAASRTGPTAELCVDMVRLLLDRGADVNLVGGDYGTALTIAVSTGNTKVVSLLLDRGADMNIGGGDYGTPLIAAISSANTKAISSENTKAISSANTTAVSSANTTVIFRPNPIPISSVNMSMVSLLLSRRAYPGVKVVDSYYGIALMAAAYQGDVKLVMRLLNRVADVRVLDGYLRWTTALGGGMGVKWAGNALNERKIFVSLLLDHGADITAVLGEYGTVLGMAAYEGDDELVKLLLDRGADIFHVGGSYKTENGEYPTALHAAQSGTANSGLLELLQGALENQQKALAVDEATDWDLSRSAEITSRSPFPMPNTWHPSFSSGVGSYRGKEPISRFQAGFRAGDNITIEQAGFPCKDLDNEILMQSLVALVGLHKIGAENSKEWIQNDIRYFDSQNFDFGLAYAAARVGWKHFNSQQKADIAMQRDRWRKQAKKLDENRAQAIYTDNSSLQELIKSPYSVMPRRLWDLRSNRVVEYRMLQAGAQSVSRSIVNSHKYRYPTFWAVTHSWTDPMVPVATPINQYQWGVPLPPGVDLEHVRAELLSFSAEYVWLDVLCLRQQSDNPALEMIRQEEWKIDVPTIGNIYRAAERLVRYFNGLGRPFSKEDWDDPRHWLQRAWTLQEISTENMTFNGGTQRNKKGILLNTVGKLGGQDITLRRAMFPLLNLTAELHKPGGYGCSMYQLTREMARRVAATPTDKVAGLLYLLRPAELPTYNAKMNAEAAWRQCFHVLPFGQKAEILFDFPYRGPEELFPSWEQMMAWPERDPEYQHSPAHSLEHTSAFEHPEWTQIRRRPELVPQGIERKGSFYISSVLAISHALLHTTESRPHEYEVQCGNRYFGFYCPYLSQDKIQTTTSQQYTLAALSIGQSFNWVVCEELGEENVGSKSADGGVACEEVVGENGGCKSADRKGNVVSVGEVRVLKKVGVLRTDSGSELLVSGVDECSSSILTTINCLFV